MEVVQNFQFLFYKPIENGHLCSFSYFLNLPARFTFADYCDVYVKYCEKDKTEVCRRASLNAQHIATLKQLGYSSRRPHRVPFLSAKSGKLNLQYHQNWTIDDWKKVTQSDESQFLLQHSDGRVRIWSKKHESMDPSCLESMVQAAADGVKVCIY